VKKGFIPVNEPIFFGNEKKYLNDCIKTRWIGSDGKYVKLFEQKLSNYVNRNYGISVSSGTAALDIAFAALDLKKNDEVILPSFTIISCLNPILRVGARPVFIDVDPDTWNMDVNQIEKRITKKTKIILAVHIYGIPVYMPKVIKIAKKYNLKVIEDASEVIGQKIKNKFCGSFGEISTFSFYTNKHITTGEGGMVFTNNRQLAEKCKKLKNLFFEDKKRFFHKEIGWNYRMSNLQAAIGLAQFENIKKIISLKRKFGLTYYNKLKEIKSIKLQVAQTNYSKNIFWVFGIVIIKNKISIEKIRNKLFKKGIQTRPFFWCLHKQPVLKKYHSSIFETLPHSEFLSKNGFYLPSGLGLKISQIKYICTELKKIFSE
tara:strand:- start:5575 stop:6696 length:1122 start_codon:yes stop_codon:yes gene_type:complete